MPYRCAPACWSLPAAGRGLRVSQSDNDSAEQHEIGVELAAIDDRRRNARLALFVGRHLVDSRFAIGLADM